MSTETGRSAGTTKPSSSIHPDSVAAVAKKDFQDAVRSYLFWGLSVFFFTLLVALAYLLSRVGDDIAAAGATTAGLIDITFGVTRLVIPLIALILGWKAIAGERESGSIKVLLSLPHSRKDVLLGKLIGRSAVLSVSLVVGFVLAGLVVAALIGSFDVVDYLGLLLVSILYGVAYTSIAIALSSMVRSTTFAAAAAFGVFATFYVVWNAVIMGIITLVGMGHLPDSDRTIEAIFLFESLDPGSAYSSALMLATSVAELDQQTQAMLESFYDGSLPFYLQDWFGLAVLAFWIFVPLGIALWRFDRVDI